MSEADSVESGYPLAVRGAKMQNPTMDLILIKNRNGLLSEKKTKNYKKSKKYKKYKNICILIILPKIELLKKK